MIKEIDFGLRSMLFDLTKTPLKVTDLELDSAFMHKSVTFRHVAEKRSKASLEYMSLWRDGISRDVARNNSFVARQGLNANYDFQGKQAVHNIKARAIKLNYTLRVWSKNLEPATDAVEELLWMQDRNARLAVIVDDVYPMEFFLNFGDVTDESTWDEKYNAGLIVCLSMPITLEGFLIKADTEKIIHRILVKLYTGEKDVNGQLIADRTMECICQI
jgi:hypothetical protein